MKKSQSMLLSAAVAGLLLGTASLASCTKPAEPKQSTNQVAADKHACKALNTCKNKGGCKSGDNGCAQKNSCSGKGGCKTIADHACKTHNECKSQGGCKTGDNGCAGKNSCRSKGGCAVPVKH